jgi:hypothetical protein
VREVIEICCGCVIDKRGVGGCTLTTGSNAEAAA